MIITIRRLLRRYPAIALALALALAAILAATVILGAGSGVQEAGEGASTPLAPGDAEVVRVVDGDTIDVRVAGRTERVRYIGMDTPETVKPGAPVECFGPQAGAANERLVGGEEVRLERDTELRDRYGRLLAYVYVNGALVNEELVRRGYATTLEIEPNTNRAEELADAERAAEQEARGLWEAC